MGFSEERRIGQAAVEPRRAIGTEVRKFRKGRMRNRVYLVSVTIAAPPSHRCTAVASPHRRRIAVPPSYHRTTAASPHNDGKAGFRCRTLRLSRRAMHLCAAGGNTH
eukprot:GFKZ01009625.1.p1 GENE.GFKZ01009625.1~~GFKZ01009625.1.p1  ORF type:complete len:107 (+),score=12.86 GFKZ01009625.1:196-516(+)